MDLVDSLFAHALSALLEYVRAVWFGVGRRVMSLITIASQTLILERPGVIGVIPPSPLLPVVASRIRIGSYYFNSVQFEHSPSIWLFNAPSQNPSLASRVSCDKETSCLRRYVHSCRK